MKRLALALMIALAFPVAAHSQSTANANPISASATITSSGGSARLDQSIPNWGGQNSCSVDVSGTWTGTLQAQISTAPINVQVTPYNSAVTQTGITANGTYLASVPAAAVFQVVGPTSTGSAVVHVNCAYYSGQVVQIGPTPPPGQGFVYLQPTASPVPQNGAAAVTTATIDNSAFGTNTNFRVVGADNVGSGPAQITLDGRTGAGGPLSVSSNIVMKDSSLGAPTLGEIATGVAGNLAGAYGGFVLIDSTKVDHTGFLEALQATPNGHVGMPQDVIGNAITTPGACTGGTICGTSTWTFNYEFLSNLGVSQAPTCVGALIQDNTTPGTMWVANINTESSTSVTFNYASLANVGASHNLIITPICLQSSF